MYLFTTSRHGVPAKELQRQLGVTYKCAWRMGHEIRKYMGEVDGDWPLRGHVEIDEVYIGGENRGRGAANRLENKTMVIGLVQRGGDIITEVLPERSNVVVHPYVRALVRKGSAVTTDDAPVYHQLGEMGYRHGAVNHSAKEYVRGEHHTNTIEGFWSLLQRAIRGTHVHVSRQHFDKCLQEFEFRFNLRQAPHLMFPRLMASFARRPHPRAVGVSPFAR
jgi:transposase-like protein